MMWSSYHRRRILWRQDPSLLIKEVVAERTCDCTLPMFLHEDISICIQNMLEHVA